MKYVRTNDAIYVFHDGADYMQYANIKDTFVKEAKTIPELCDKFIIHENRIFGMTICIRTSWNTTKEYVARYNRELKGYIHSVYGAIWTTGANGEPILKSVAKLNKDGKFELL